MWEIIRADLMHVSTGFLNPTIPSQHMETSAVSEFSVAFQIFSVNIAMSQVEGELLRGWLKNCNKKKGIFF